MHTIQAPRRDSRCLKQGPAVPEAIEEVSLYARDL